MRNDNWFHGLMGVIALLLATGVFVSPPQPDPPLGPAVETENLAFLEVREYLEGGLVLARANDITGRTVPVLMTEAQSAELDRGDKISTVYRSNPDGSVVPIRWLTLR